MITDMRLIGSGILSRLQWDLADHRLSPASIEPAAVMPVSDMFGLFLLCRVDVTTAASTGELRGARSFFKMCHYRS